MPPKKKKKTKHPRRTTNAINIDPKVYGRMVTMAKIADRPIKTELERIINAEHIKREGGK